jgi:hypothetical protein
MADGISGDGALIIKADPTKMGVPIRLLERRADWARSRKLRPRRQGCIAV